MINKHHTTGGRVDFVTDQYPTLSIKYAERQRREKKGSLQVEIYIVSSKQKCPRQWSKFLSLGSNKTNLVEFFVREWSTPDYNSMLGTSVLYVTSGKKCWNLISSLDGVIQ